MNVYPMGYVKDVAHVEYSDLREDDIFTWGYKRNNDEFFDYDGNINVALSDERFLSLKGSDAGKIHDFEDYHKDRRFTLLDIELVYE